jgi:hypothetical protein
MMMMMMMMVVMDGDGQEVVMTELALILAAHHLVVVSLMCSAAIDPHLQSPRVSKQQAGGGKEGGGSAPTPSHACKKLHTLPPSLDRAAARPQGCIAPPSPFAGHTPPVSAAPALEESTLLL